MKSKKRAKARKFVKVIKAVKNLCDETNDRVIIGNNELKMSCRNDTKSTIKLSVNKEVVKCIIDSGSDKSIKSNDRWG